MMHFHSTVVTLESGQLPITLVLITVIIVLKDFLTATIMTKIAISTITLLPVDLTHISMDLQLDAW